MPKTAVKKRIEFCKKYQSWTKERWSEVLFSDESTFKQFTNTNRFVRRPSGSDPNNPRYTVSTVKHSPQVMVWACFAFNGRGALHFIPNGQKMNSTSYLNILQDKLKTWMQITNTKTFLHDYSPCHEAKKVTQWLLHEGIEVIDWPSYSPDLNPIENMWAIFKRKLSEKKILSLPHLKSCIKEVWCTEITNKLCQDLAQSMPSRIQKVLKNHGHATKY